MPAAQRRAARLACCASTTTSLLRCARHACCGTTCCPHSAPTALRPFGFRTHTAACLPTTILAIHFPTLQAGAAAHEAQIANGGPAKPYMPPKSLAKNLEGPIGEMRDLFRTALVLTRKLDAASCMLHTRALTLVGWALLELRLCVCVCVCVL